MEVNDLHLFLAIAESKSISGAAERLHTVQSNVSTRLRALETRVGAQLFHRHARGVTLTSSGELFLPYAKRIVQLMYEGMSVIADVDDPVGTLAIGSMETTAGWRLPQLLALFAEDCPHVDVSLRTGPTDELVRDVVEHRLEGAFVAGPVISPDLQQRTVYVEDLVLVTARRVQDVSDLLRALDPDEDDNGTVVDGPGRQSRLLVFREGCSYRRRLVGLAAPAAGRAPSIVEFGSVEGILGCVAAGMGVTLLPASVVRASSMRDELRMHSLPAEQARAETVFVRRADSPLGPAMRRFLDHLDAMTTPPDLRSVGTTA